MKKVLIMILMLSLLFLNSCTDDGVIENWWGEKEGEKTQAELLDVMFAKNKENMLELKSVGFEGFYEAAANGSRPSLSDLPAYDIDAFLRSIDYNGFRQLPYSSGPNNSLFCFNKYPMNFVQIIDTENIVSVYRLQDEKGRSGWLYVQFARNANYADKDYWGWQEILFCGKTLFKSDFYDVHNGDSFSKLVEIDSTFGLYMGHRSLYFEKDTLIEVKWPLADCNMKLVLDVSRYSEKTEDFSQLIIKSISFEKKNPEKSILDRLELPEI